MSEFTLVTGGARSGKSSHAERLAGSLAGRVWFVATAEGKDDEMRDRIAAHRHVRPPTWVTLEEPTEVPGALRRSIPQGADSADAVVLLDCITLWVSNLLLAGRDVLSMVDALVELQRESQLRLIAVTSEVGMGIVPEHLLARQYRDLLGQANQRLAAAADRVILMVAGIPVTIKAPEN